jgi:hypothetical protein
MNPPSAARALMNDLTKPLKHELPYIKKVHGGAWVRTIADERLRGISTKCVIFLLLYFSAEHGLAKICAMWVLTTKLRQEYSRLILSSSTFMV